MKIVDAKVIICCPGRNFVTLKLVNLSVHNFGIQEYMRHSEETDRVFPHRYRFAEGFMHPGDAPGLGVDIDEDLAARYPHERV